MSQPSTDSAAELEAWERAMEVIDTTRGIIKNMVRAFCPTDPDGYYCDWYKEPLHSAVQYLVDSGEVRVVANVPGKLLRFSFNIRDDSIQPHSQPGQSPKPSTQPERTDSSGASHTHTQEENPATACTDGLSGHTGGISDTPSSSTSTQ